MSYERIYNTPTFSSWEAALTYVLQGAQQEHLALVIDEFSSAVDADPALPSVIQRLWDNLRRASSHAFLILCTSCTEAVERHFLVDGPLYRRRTRDLRVEPFGYREAGAFFPAWSTSDRALTWGIVGGVPSYLDALRGSTVEEAVVEHILDKSAVLYREAETLLSQEVRGVGPPLLRAMLQAIAFGANEPNQIGRRIGRPFTALSGALGLLIDYGLVERRVPFTVSNAERTRQTRYYIADNYLSFWFRFVLPNRSTLEQGQAASTWQAKIEPQMSTYMGPRFEELCRQFIHRNPSRWLHRIGDLGAWWRANEELDIVGLDGRRVVLAAEAKWTNQPVGLDVLHTLQRRVALLPDVAPDAQLALFAKSGFTPEVEAARGAYVVLYTLDALYA